MITTPTALRTGALALALAAASACQSGLASDSAAPTSGDVAAADRATADPLAAAAPAPAARAASAPAASTDVLVQVNGKPLTRAQVDEKIDVFVGPQLAMVPAEQREQVRAQLARRVLDEMVVQTLLGQAAEEKQITVSDAEVESTVRDLGTKLPPGKTMDDYLKVAGMTAQDLKRELASELRIEKLIDREVASPAAPADQEIASFYTENIEHFTKPERVRVRHVLVASTPEDDAATRAAKRSKAEAIRDELVAGKGERFAEIAAAKSDCPSKERGGDLGEVARGELVPAFETAAFGQTEGEIGPVVETEFGYHVIQVQEHREAGSVPLEEARAEIVEQLAADKKRVAVEAYIDGLRNSASIVYPEKEAA
jgi:parvulin-like peptidyl-prolyl isomerase